MSTDEPDDRTPHRVALVVFATVNAVDQTDAEHVVQRALRTEFTRSPNRINVHELPPVLRYELRAGTTWDVTYGKVVPLLSALSDGLLDVAPTDRAFPYENWSDHL